MDTYRHPSFKATHKHEAIPKLSLAYEFTGVGFVCSADARTALERHFHVNGQPQR
jgi:hypothetical protein